MSEPFNDFEGRLAAALRSHADHAQSSWSTDAVVADIRDRTRQGRSRLRMAWLLPMAAAVPLAIVAALFLLRPDIPGEPDGGQGSSAATAIVADRTYFVAPARKLDLGPGDLTPYGPVSPTRMARALFSEMTAYSLHGVDPGRALVVPAKPGLSDDSGPLGRYWLLQATLSNLTELCPYRKHPKPTWCT